MTTPQVQDQGIQEALLLCIYGLYQEWAGGFDFACQKGCAACCTVNVTMTTLEGQQIVAYLEKEKRLQETIQLLAISSPEKRPRPKLTTNAFARHCLQQEELPEDEDQWSFAPCPFLKGSSCTIYPARPFGCRSFASLEQCQSGGEAVVPPHFIALNTAILQLIEHIDMQDGLWGNMADVLDFLIAGDKVDQLTRPHSLPGFLISTEDQKEITPLLNQLSQAQIGETSFEALFNQLPACPSFLS